MPIHEYVCESCKKRFEKLQKISDKPCKKCPACGGSVRKLISSPAIQFKGNGFYITDYAKKNIPDKESRPKDKPKAEKSGESKTGTDAAETVSSKKPGPDKPTPDK
jgi:putative FmdB family regulatory protein